MSESADILLKEGDHVGPYLVEKWLGVGAEGYVAVARSADGRKVALKQAKLGASVERAERQQQLVGKRCPTVAEIFEVFEYKGFFFVAMELVDGETLGSILLKKGCLTLAEFVPIAFDMLDGLEFLHNENIVHRDIKPENLIVRQDTEGKYRAKLIDLGIALHRDLTRVTVTGVLGPGSHAYMSLEALKGRDILVDDRADLYSFGIVLFEVLTGRLPIEAASEKSLVAKVSAPYRPSLSDYIPDADPALDAYVHRLISAQPRDRYSSAAEAKEALEHIIAGAHKDRSAEERHTSIPEKDTDDRVGATSDIVAVPPLSRCKDARETDGVCLMVLSGPNYGTHIPVNSGGVCLGRALNSKDMLISRVHARARLSSKGIRLRCLGSANGIIHEGRRVRKALLAPGESAIIGSTELRCTNRRGD